MRCDDARQHWDLFHDSEGDAELHFQINEHLAVCPYCAQWFQQQSRLEGLIAERLSQTKATEALWDRVLSRSGLQRMPATRRWLVFSAVGALAACLVLAVTVGIRHGLRAPGGADLSEPAAQWHDRLLAGRERVEFSSDSDLEVEAYLRERVDFPVRCPPRKDAGFAVRGAGICELARVQAAYLVGEVDGSPVSIFILSRASLDPFPVQLEAGGREKTHRWGHGTLEMVAAEIDRNVVLVIGNTRHERLLRVLRAYGTYPEPHHG